MDAGRDCRISVNGFAPGGADDAHVAQQQPVDLHRRDLARSEADHDEPPEACQCADAVEKAISADRVVGHVHAPPASELAHLVLPGIADEHDVISPGCASDLALRFGGHQSDDRTGADRLGHLDARCAHPA